MRRLRRQEPEIEPHAGMKTAVGISVIAAIVFVVIFVAAILLIWVF